MADSAAVELVFFDAAEQQRTRIAWLYYVEGLTKRDSLSCCMSWSVQSGARRLPRGGIVQIRINAKLAPCVALEQELVAR